MNSAALRFIAADDRKSDSARTEGKSASPSAS
jgi:hypothetical protein